MITKSANSWTFTQLFTQETNVNIFYSNTKYSSPTQTKEAKTFLPTTKGLNNLWMPFLFPRVMDNNNTDHNCCRHNNEAAPSGDLTSVDGREGQWGQTLALHLLLLLKPPFRLQDWILKLGPSVDMTTMIKKDFRLHTRQRPHLKTMALQLLRLWWLIKGPVPRLCNRAAVGQTIGSELFTAPTYMWISHMQETWTENSDFP